MTVFSIISTFIRKTLREFSVDSGLCRMTEHIHRLTTFFKEVHGLESGFVIKHLQEIRENICVFPIRNLENMKQIIK